MQRGTLRESDTASRREEACLLNPFNVVAQLVTTACYSGLDTDMLLVQRRVGPKSDHEKTTRIIHCAHRTFARFAWFPSLAW